MLKFKANEGIKILCLLYFFCIKREIAEKNEAKTVQILCRISAPGEKDGVKRWTTGC